MVENRIWALRAAEVGLLAATWLFLSGFVIGGGALVWGSGIDGLGVTFPHWPLVIANLSLGFVAMIFSAARAWQHQPSAFSWICALIGLILLMIPLYSGAPAVLLWQNVIAGAVLAIASGMSAVEARGAITQAPALDWAGHPVFVSAEPEARQLRPAPPDAGNQPPEADFTPRPGKSPTDRFVGMESPDDDLA